MEAGTSRVRAERVDVGASTSGADSGSATASSSASAAGGRSDGGGRESAGSSGCAAICGFNGEEVGARRDFEVEDWS